jgi:UDP-N-acetylmuramate--alanine ligase
VFSLDQPIRVHIIAVGGAAMSAIATILHDCGHHVSGSDSASSVVLDLLVAQGIDVHVGHNASRVLDADVVIHSAAIRTGNVELDAAVAAGIPTLTRADAMEVICRGKRVLAVSGAHGKTTTSSMLATVLVDAGYDPSFLVGATVGRFGSGVRWVHTSEWFVLEADESDGSFLRANAEAVIVTNADPDHLDYWGTEEALLNGYRSFIAHAELAVVCMENPASRLLATEHIDAAAADHLHTYGWSPNGAWRIEAFTPHRLASTFDVADPAGERTTIDIKVPGDHNALNATAVFALSRLIGIPATTIAESLRGFGRVSRRFEFRGEARGVTFVDDYAHLPAEVASTVAGARRADWKRVIAVFQPHRYTRVRDVGRQFGTTFADADIAIVTGIYAAGQEPIEGITGRTVFDAVDAARPGRHQHYCETRPELVALLENILAPGDLVLTMNAGDLTTLPDEMLGSSWGVGA